MNKLNMQTSIFVIVIIILVLIFVSSCFYSQKALSVKPINHLDSLLSQDAVRRFRTTGGAGICPSISQYYDPILGYCLERPKMVYGAEYGSGPCFFDSDCKNCGPGTGPGVCDRFGECHCGPGFVRE